MVNWHELAVRTPSAAALPQGRLLRLHRLRRPRRAAAPGFTLIELLVVLAAMALLLGLVVPRYLAHVDRAREAVLRQNLATMRDAIDKFRADRGRYPEELAELARERYVRALPLDPITERSDGWILVGPPAGEAGKVYDLHSGAAGVGRDGVAYVQW